MKRNKMMDNPTTRRGPRTPHAVPAEKRQGSTIVIVLVLVSMLLVLGMVFFTLASQERASGQNFSDAFKGSELKLDFFEPTLRQIIIGANQNEYNSALFGGRHSLMATMYGSDIQPYSGEGINLVWDSASGLPVVDQNYDGTDDNRPLALSYLDINSSLATRRQFPQTEQDLTVLGGLSSFPAPDVDYTYPDINNVFLAYDAVVPNETGGTVRVMIPSFMRPQFLRNLLPSPGSPGGTGPGDTIAPKDWYSHPDTVGRILRPHELHRAVTDQGAISTVFRYVRTQAEADALPSITRPFPFPTPKMGVWTNDKDAAGNAVYELDADPDNDGVKDAIYTDIHYPLMEQNGQQFVAIPAITIIDADGKFNLNAHGNAAARTTINAPPFGNNDFISRSNQGLSSGEVNPQWGLHTNPASVASTDLQQHNFYYDRDPADIVELSNMEWWWLQTGRPVFQNGPGIDNMVDLLPGRYGEFELLPNAWVSKNPFRFPSPGFTYPDDPLVGVFIPNQDSGADDNHNLFEGSEYIDGAGQVFPAFVQFPPYRHPLDLRGAGRFVMLNNDKQRLFALNVGPHKWPQYEDYSAHEETGYWNLPSIVDTSLRNVLLPGFSPGYQVDEPAEMILESKLRSSLDAVFGVEENAALHLSNNDLIVLDITGRVNTLAPINLSRANKKIRKQFTTTSSNLKTYGKPFFKDAANTFRNWEFSADLDSDTLLEFPPNFGGTVGINQLPNRDLLQPLNLDPFRSELRELLLIEPGDINLRKIQRRLSINGVLDRNPRNGRLRFRPLTPHPNDLNNPLARDPVTQQIRDAGKTFRFSNDLLPRYPEEISNLVEQEYLARFDRQRMARDIYVLLYTLGGGNDGQNYTNDNSGLVVRTLYTNAQLRTMAQFAVNLVDALDSDDVITKFEYDKNLGSDPNSFPPTQGWNLDDDPYGQPLEETSLTPGATDYDPNYPEDGLERGVVYGVEEQKLTFSEVLVIAAREVNGGDEPETQYKDERDRFFTYIELRNASPTTVYLNNESWQIQVIPVLAATQVFERRLTLQIGTVASGGLFTIGTVGEDDMWLDPLDFSKGRAASFFRVNPDGTGFRTLAPISGLLDLDLIPKSQNIIDLSAINTFRLSEGTTDPNLWYADGPRVNTIGEFLNENTVGNLAVNPNPQVTFVLRRRLNPLRQPPVEHAFGGTNKVIHDNQSWDNPWIEVDRIDIDGYGDPYTARSFDLNTNETLQSKLIALTSQERRQPLDRVTQPGGVTVNPFAPNSLGSNNSNSLANFTLWQPHFDRDFSSVIELFNIPLYGPGNLTSQLAVETINRFQELNTAGSRFLNPNYAIAIPDPMPVPSITFTNPSIAPDLVSNAGVISYDNRWHRLLEFVEVPTRASKHFDNPWFTVDIGKFPTPNDPSPLLRIFRHPGDINLNTIQYPTVLGGMIDDALVGMTFDPLTQVPVALPDKYEFTSRDWWWEFLKARDGFDPLDVSVGGTSDSMGGFNGLLLPGVPRLTPVPPASGVQQGSRPFRNLGFSQNGLSSLEDTVLRSLPRDFSSTPPTTPRGLFEVGDKVEHDTFLIDYATKHRLLAKVLNNSTTRSNVFLVFIQIDFFEAIQVSWLNPDTNQTEQVVRIGGKLSSSIIPRRRGFFVIDRSNAMELIHQQTAYIPRQWRDSQGIERFAFSFYNNGVNQRVSPPQDVSIPMDYRPLILHREIIEGEN